MAFLEWLRDGHFILLGARAYEMVAGPGRPLPVHVEPGSGLGILRADEMLRFATPTPLDQLPEFLRERLMGQAETCS